VPNEHHHRLSRIAVLDSAILAIACLITFMLVTDLLPRVYHLSRADDLIGGLWAVIAAVFVFRDTYQHSMSAAVSRTAATAAITTAVVLVASAVSPQHAWQQPILRLADTVVGVAIGVAAAWLGLRVTGQQAGAST
jgi:uncharacterized membrane protein YccC